MVGSFLSRIFRDVNLQLVRVFSRADRACKEDKTLGCGSSV